MECASIFEAMRSDPKLHFTAGEELIEASKVAMQRAWDAMPAWFEVLPQAPCAVEATTTGAKAFYFPPATDGSRGGTFFVNVDDPASWGTFELESMAFHEGIPGHQFIFEPDAATVLTQLLPRYVATRLFQAVLESKASEESSRMVAMKNATENAEELIEDLTLSYNKVRQSNITREMIEIASGANAR